MRYLIFPTLCMTCLLIGSLVGFDTPDHARFASPYQACQKYMTGETYLSTQLVDYQLQRQEAQIQVSWDGSFRDDINWDAAWIFFKGKDAQGNWHHLNIQAVATDDEASLDIPDDRVGFFAYNRERGEGTNNWRMKVKLIPQEGIQEVRVYGLEMVYVPTGPFWLGTNATFSARDKVITAGSGGAPLNAFFTFSETAKDNHAGPYRVKSEQPIAIGEGQGNLIYRDAVIRGANTYSGDKTGTLAADFPKGYEGFYAMKYELTEQNYCDFLNTLTPKQQIHHETQKTIEYKRSTRDFRHQIYVTDGLYQTRRPLRACNFISWRDGLAYADWAGIRHMTELEFEKAARGPEDVVFREFVWGVNDHQNKNFFQVSKKLFDYQGKKVIAENGAELTDGNVNVDILHYKDADDVCEPSGRFYDPGYRSCRKFHGGDGLMGPLRVGIFGANSQGDRIRAGASYYGLMELGGNLQEPVVTVGHPHGRKFSGSHGDGQLDEEGQATNRDWIAEDGQYVFGYRGGCWRFHNNHARTADRFMGLRTKFDRRWAHVGFRGVRSR
ncbi:MAG: SUMF1/EgtB/PvdO family nonheme iron enzyme [Bacteroidota bacterium]